MGKQWVDITTITNTVPFTKVRWKSDVNGGDTWFSEAPGLVTDGKHWGDGNTAAWGWYGGHRMNTYQYTCGFQCDVTGIDNGLLPNVYRSHIKDAERANSTFYDTYVIIDHRYYFEVDFSLWDGAAGKSLYAPYQNMPWSPGDIYVEIGTDPVVLSTNNMSFASTGGSQTVDVTADDSWTAVVSDSWITASTLSGVSGQTTVTISTPDYQDTTSARTGTVVFTSNGFSATLTVRQNKKTSGVVTNLYLGDLDVEALYLGDQEVEALYLGDQQIF